MQAAGDGVFELNVECWQIGAQASFTATKVSMASKIAKLNTKYIDKISLNSLCQSVFECRGVNILS